MKIVEYATIAVFVVIMVWALIKEVLEENNDFYIYYRTHHQDREASNPDEGEGSSGDN